MTGEKTYTLAELQQAQKQLDGYQSGYLVRITTQADKNRNQGFTEEQVRAAVARRAMQDYQVPVATRFAEDVIADLRCPKPEFTEGGVYRKPGRHDLYLRRNGRWEMFGSSAALASSVLRTDDLERVL